MSPADGAGPVSIRAANPDDAADVRALVHALAVYEKEPDKVKMTDESARHALAAGHVQALLGFREGKAVAMALYFFNFSSWTGKRGLFLEDLFVSPEVRKQGLGLELLKRLAAIAVANDCGRMEWNVLDWNDSAEGFYRMLGARQAAGWEVWRLQGDALTSLGG
jgi:GNAT superfamily N-acetyltransferase